MPSDPSRPGFRFEPVVTAGNILSATLLLISVLVWGLRLEGRVSSEVALRDEQHAEIQRRLDSTEALHRDELRDIKDSLSRIEAKIDQKADKK